jgi:hypothetical protein
MSYISSAVLRIDCRCFLEVEESVYHLNGGRVELSRFSGFEILAYKVRRPSQFMWEDVEACQLRAL